METFFALHDPSMDATAQYKSAIWPQTASQAAAAQAAIAQRRAGAPHIFLLLFINAPCGGWRHQGLCVRDEGRERDLRDIPSRSGATYPVGTRARAQRRPHETDV